MLRINYSSNNLSSRLHINTLLPIADYYCHHYNYFYYNKEEYTTLQLSSWLHRVSMIPNILLSN